MRNVSLVVVIAFMASAAVAQTDAVQGWTGGTQYAIYYGASTGDVVGWTFDVTQDIVVTDLGAWIDQSTTDPGMDSEHMVGLWDSGQNLLASTTVMPASGEFNGFRYESVAPVALTTGETYTVGAMYTATDLDWYISGASNVVTAPEVNWVNSNYPASGDLGFVFPVSTSPSGGRFGANFLYIPEPTSLLLLGLSVLLRRR
jgi:hypothetical protein